MTKIIALVIFLDVLVLALSLTGCKTMVAGPHDNERHDDLTVNNSKLSFSLALSDPDHRDVTAQPGSLGSAFKLSYADNDVGRTSTSWALVPIVQFTNLRQSFKLSTGTFHLWAAKIDLKDLPRPGTLGIPWLIYKEPGTYGYSLAFRVSIRRSTGAPPSYRWDPMSFGKVSLSAGLEMIGDAFNGQLPEEDVQSFYTDTVHLRITNYKPNVTRGYVAGSDGPDYSRCVPNLVGQASQIYSSSAYDSDIELSGTVNVPSTGGRTSAHNQGFVRFRDEANKNTKRRRTRVGMTQSGNAGLTVVRKATQPPLGSTWLGWDASGFGYRNLSIRNQYSHPGGAQAHGDVVVIAMEKPNDSGSGAAAYFARYKADVGDGRREQLELLNTLARITPEQASRYGMQPNAAAAAGFVKLANGYFLLAIAGADDGKEGVWFFESDETMITLYTKWHFVDVWKPPCTGRDWNESKGTYCWAGAAAAINLLTDCSGQVYLYALSGDRGPGKDYSDVQLWRVDQTSGGRISLRNRMSWWKSFGAVSALTPSCRYACGTHVTGGGQLTLAVAARDGGWSSTKTTNIKTYLAQKPFDAAMALESLPIPDNGEHIEAPDEGMEQELFPVDEMSGPASWVDPTEAEDGFEPGQEVKGETP